MILRGGRVVYIACLSSQLCNEPTLVGFRMASVAAVRAPSVKSFPATSMRQHWVSLDSIVPRERQRIPSVRTMPCASQAASRHLLPLE